jgi:hypothetical protein
MNNTEARTAARLASEVYYQGDAVVIDSVRGTRATITGDRHHGVTVNISELEAPTRGPGRRALGTPGDTPDIV